MGEGNCGGLRKDETDVLCVNLLGEGGRCIGESVPGVLLAKRGEVIREDVDTLDPGRGGAICGEGEPCKSGVPFAWKNFACDRSSPISEPTADLELDSTGGIVSPFA